MCNTSVIHSTLARSKGNAKYASGTKYIEQCVYVRKCAYIYTYVYYQRLKNVVHIHE